MPNKKNEIKVSVDSRAKKAPKRSAAAKTKTAGHGSGPASIKPPSASAVSGNKPFSRSATGKRPKGGALSVLASIFITALVIGGAIYAWQQKASDSAVKEAKEEAETIKRKFEKELASIENKLNGVQSEKDELLDTAKELEKKALLLEDSLRGFESEDLGISFLYPAVFGEAKITFENTADSGIFTGSFSENEKLLFGGISRAYISSTTVPYVFLQSAGYDKVRNSYYYLGAGDIRYEFEPLKEIPNRIGNALLVDNKSFSLAAGDDLGSITDLGQNIGAVMNLENGKYSGIAFVNMDFGVFPLENFEKMIMSIE